MKWAINYSCNALISVTGWVALISRRIRVWAQNPFFRPATHSNRLFKYLLIWVRGGGEEQDDDDDDELTLESEGNLLALFLVLAFIAIAGPCLPSRLG